MKTKVGDAAKDVASKINAYLKKFEADKRINKVHPTYKTQPYFMAGAYASGRKVSITYVSYQGSGQYDLDEAMPYLAWLEAGNEGRIGDFLHKSGLAKKLRDEKLENLCFMPEEGCRPKFTDPMEARLSPYRRDAVMYDGLYNAFYAMLEAFAPAIPKPEKVSKYGDAPQVPINSTPTGSFPTWHRMTPEQREAVRNLFVETSNGIQKAYARGLDNGRDLLGSLARGEISVGEFEQRKTALVTRKEE